MALLTHCSDDEKFTIIGWALGEFCMMYFSPNKVHQSWHKDLRISNEMYDLLEKEYNFLAEKLGKEPYTSNLIGWSVDSASAKLVEEKLSNPKGNHEPVLSANHVIEYFGSIRQSS